MKYKIDREIAKNMVGATIIVALTGYSYVTLKPMVNTACLYYYANYATDQEYSERKLVEYLDMNKNLTKEEKNFIKDHFDLLDENKNYVNVNYLLFVLPKLKITYTFDRKPYNSDKNVGGLYSKNGIEIVVYDCHNFKDADKGTLLHELNHAFGPLKNMEENSTALSEAVNETIRCEYDETSKFSDRSYQTQSLVLYSLCEIIDPEVFLNYHFNGDISVVKNSLNQIIDDKAMSTKLFSDMDKIENYENQIMNLGQTDPDTCMNAYDEYKKNNKEISDIINKYFTKKYGYPIDQDSIMECYLCNNLFTDGGDKPLSPFYCKGYFNDDYISRNPSINYRDDEQDFVLKLNTPYQRQNYKKSK